MKTILVFLGLIISIGTFFLLVYLFPVSFGYAVLGACMFAFLCILWDIAKILTDK